MQRQKGDFRKLYINKLLNAVVLIQFLNLLNSYGFVFYGISSISINTENRKKKKTMAIGCNCKLCCILVEK